MPKRSRTEEIPERRNRKSTCLDDLRINRSIDNNVKGYPVVSTSTPGSGADYDMACSSW